MMLHCTLVAGPGSTLDSGPVELSIDLADACAGSELEAAVSRRFGTGPLTVDRMSVAGLSVGEHPLVQGAVLVDSTAFSDGGLPSPVPAVAPLVLAVHSGPGAGLVFPLRRGRFRIGRSGTEVIVPDPELSREHALLDVSDSAITLRDLGSANGVFVDGRKVRAAAVSTESTIRCGRSSMSLVFGAAHSGGVPSCAGADVSEPVVVPNPVHQLNRTALVLGALLPLAMGVGMAVLTGMWIFLAFTAVSAVSVLVPVTAGQRQRRVLRADVAVAVKEDAERRRRAAPSAGEVTLRLWATSKDPPNRSAADPAAVWLRLGLTQQDANLRLEPFGPGFRSPPLGVMPVTLNPETPVTTLQGPGSAVEGLVRSMLLQFAAYPAARRTKVLIHAPTPSLLAARFLPGAELSAQIGSTLETITAGPGESFARGVLIIAAAAGTAGISTAAASHGWQVITCSPAPAAAEAGGTTVVLGEPTARMSGGASPAVEFSPDLVPASVFDRCCRRMAAAANVPAAPPAPLCRAGSPGSLLQVSEADIAVRWATSAPRSGLPVVLGRCDSGPLLVDLQADGPHFLVAGTTGSGKSELLRTLAAGLAIAHPPERVNLLFIDFKGGSALRPLSGLVHCVGLLTDLALDEVERALISLRAEVRRREELLSCYEATDLPAYEALAGTRPPLPHLVLLIDEFRMLVDQAPQALAELMRIAAIGRSLGIHLILATQRPQGAVSADIRANVTSCIALRVQSVVESIDIINAPLAAAIPITTPGRAFLVRGSGAPEEFQTAAISLPSHGSETSIKVWKTVEFLAGPPDGPSAGPSAGPQGDAMRHPPEAIRHLTDTVRAVWRAAGGATPRRPVAEPLPPSAPFPAGAVPGRRIRLGLLDLPGEQRVTEFNWCPASHGHLALVSGLAGGADAALELVVNQLLTYDAESHLYFLDANGRFTGIADAPRVGAVVALQDLRRAARVLERLADEVNNRMTRPESAARCHSSRPGVPAEPHTIVLVLCGWGSWVSAFRSGPLAWAEDLLQDIVRDGPRTGITVLVTGERELVTSRFFPALPNRIFLPAGSTEEGRLAWPRVAVTSIAGRVAVFGPLSLTASASGTVGQLFEFSSRAGHGDHAPVRTRPFRVEALPRQVTAAEVRFRSVGGIGILERDGPGGGPRPATPFSAATHGLSGQLLLGVAGDELLPAGLHLPRGAVLAALGGEASGKSSLLASLPLMNPEVRFVRPSAGADPEQFWAENLDAARSGALHPDMVLLIDDLDLRSSETNDRLLLMNTLGWRAILTAGFNPGVRQRVPLVHQAVGQGRGLLIGPRTLMHGDLFGIRFDLEQNPPPGRAVLISGGQALAVQLAFDPGSKPTNGV